MNRDKHISRKYRRIRIDCRLIYCHLLAQLTVRSILEYATKSGALKCILDICLPIPGVCTSLALLCAPSPLVVYAATETEYKVSAFRSPKISSCGRKHKIPPSNTANSLLSILEKKRHYLLIYSPFLGKNCASAKKKKEKKTYIRVDN